MEKAHLGNLIHIQAAGVREVELLWLKRCLLAEAKTHVHLNDLSSLLEGAGFRNLKVKYVGGLRVLLECSSIEDTHTFVKEGLHSLYSWFSWVRPWSVELEEQRPGRLLWLSISGVPLHVWHRDMFSAIATAFGKVLEVEDWTEEKEQTHLGRVLILSYSDTAISESIRLMAAGHGYLVKVTEDVAEIVDFGPRYEMEKSRSVTTAEEGSGCGEVNVQDSPYNSDMDKASLGSLDKANLKPPCQLKSRHLEIMEALITTSDADSEGKEEGEIDVSEEGEIVAGSKRGLGGHDLDDLGLGPFPSPIRSAKETQLETNGMCDKAASLTKAGLIHPNPLLKVPASSSSLNSSIAPTFNLPSATRPILKPSLPIRWSGDFVGKLSLREAKRMARLKIASRRSSSSSLLRKAAATLSAPIRPTSDMHLGTSNPESIAQSFSFGSRKEKAIQLGGLVGFRYDARGIGQISTGACHVHK